MLADLLAQSIFASGFARSAAFIFSDDRAAPATVRVVKVEKAVDTELFSTKIRARSVVFLAMAADLPAEPAEDDTLSIGGVEYAIQGEPALETDGTVWRIEAVKL